MKYKSSYKRKYSVSKRYGNGHLSKQIIRYYGGKHILTPKIISITRWLVSEYGFNVYAELCGGGARTLLNMPYGLYDRKIYNEYSLGLCKLFSCVKDPELCRKLVEILRQLPYRKELFQYAIQNKDKPEIDTLTGAVLTYISAMQSINANMRSFRLVNSEMINREIIQQYYRKVSRIKYCTEVLSDTAIINGNMLTVIEQLSQSSNVLSYIDPSYHPCTRNQSSLKVYPYEMTREEHVKMVELLLATNMGVILSGYDPAQYGCNDYEPLNPANGWIKKSLGLVHRPSSSKGGYGSKKEEFLWIKTPRR